MKTQVEDISEVKKTIHFEIPWEDIDEHIQHAVRQISRTARIPGFRPGKAPDSVIRSRFAQHIKDDVINHVVPEAYREAMEENKFDVVSEPSLHDVMYSEGSPFLFKVTIETRPAIELKEYKGLTLEAEKLEVTDEEIDTVLQNFQQRAAQLVPFPDDTAIENGHFVNSLAKATIEKNNKKRTIFDSEILIPVGIEDTHPVFTENLLGKKAGDTVGFDISYPQDHFEKQLAGKNVHYEVTINSVNRKELPPIDDDLAKDLGEYQSLNELKDKVRQDIQSMKERGRREDLKEKALAKVIDNHPFPVPESLVRAETQALLQNYAQALHRRGVDVKDPNIKWDEMAGQMNRQADQNIRGSLLIKAIADAENIQVEEEDLDKAIQQIADQQKRAPEAIKADLIKEERLDSLKNRLRLSKTLDFIIDNSTLTEVEKKKEEKNENS